MSELQSYLLGYILADASVRKSSIWFECKDRYFVDSFCGSLHSSSYRKNVSLQILSKVYPRIEDKGNYYKCFV